MAATSGWSPSQVPTSSMHISPTSSTRSQMSLKAAFTSRFARSTGIFRQRACHHRISRATSRCRGWSAGGWSSFRHP
eukprot:1112846-Heterocapsa_arctica.AAC.1